MCLNVINYDYAILHIMREFENPDCTDSALQQNGIGIADQKDDCKFCKLWHFLKFHWWSVSDIIIYDAHFMHFLLKLCAILNTS